jgi:CelD/BcsL family acetyltransferase involved in cellulose biosynthesis
MAVIRVIRDQETFLGLKDDWDSFVSERFAGHPLLGHCWFANYYRAYFPGAPLYILCAYDDGGTLIAGLPLVLGKRRPTGITLKEARLLAGTHSHVNRVLVTAEGGQILSGFLDQTLGDGVDLIYLEDLPDCFPDRQWFDDYCCSRKVRLDVRSVRRSPFIPTTGSFEDYRKMLSKKFRELLNNRLNRIKKAGGFEIRTFSTPESFDQMLADMKTVAAESWQGENNSGLFSGGDNALFYTSLLQHALENGYGRVFILYFEGQPAAFEFHMYHGATEYCLKAEYSQKLTKLSPGGVLDGELVKRAFDTDISVYDLLGFEDEYKLRWTQQVTPYFRYFIFNRTAAARTAYWVHCRLAERLRRSGIVRRWIKPPRQGQGKTEHGD